MYFLKTFFTPCVSKVSILLNMCALQKEKILEKSFFDCCFLVFYVQNQPLYETKTNVLILFHFVLAIIS